MADTRLTWKDVYMHYISSEVCMVWGPIHVPIQQFTVDNIKKYVPVLRAMEDMTEQEIVEWLTKWPIQAIGSDDSTHTMHFDPKWVESGEAEIERTAGNITVKRTWFEHFRKDYFVYCRLFEGLYTPDQVHWFVSHGFNVFGLEWEIEAIRKEVSE